MFAKMTSLSRGNSSNNLRNADKVQKTLIAVCQMNATSLKADNLQTIIDLVATASSRGAQMVFLPEACDYIGETKNQSIDYSEPLHGNFIHQLKKAAIRHKVWLSVGSFHQRGPENQDKPKLINTHIIIDSEGKIRATYDKAHLFDLDIAGKVRLCESDFVIPGSKVIPPVSTPIGRIGMATCYDVRFPELSLALAHQGAQIITYPSAFTQTTGMAHWECLLRARAIETQCYVIAAAQTGKHNAKRSSYGHAMVVDPWGAIIAQCSEGVGLCLAEIDLDYVAKVRSEMPVWQHRRTDLYGRVIALDSDASIIPPDDQPIYQFGHIKIPSSHIFYRTRLSIAFVNIKPVLPGHALIAPLRVAVNLADLNPAEVTDLFLTVQHVTEILKKHFKATSSTMAIQDGLEAGQTVQHVHVHILPRKFGDFSDNDDIYDHLQNHDKGWTEHTKLRSAEEMAEEARQLRVHFYTKPADPEEQSAGSSDES
uniref:Bis(5'-adenosyl)-triphosphatase n=1 Tax=Biomphalaria glabrata TaxID=6526 RepID=A0A2C9JV67_BIOGL